MEKNEQIEKDVELLNNVSFLVKAFYMSALLKPDEKTKYVVFDEDEPNTFKYEGKDVQIKKGHLLHKTDNRVPWENITAKYTYQTNAQMFKKLSASYITKAINIILAKKGNEFMTGNDYLNEETFVVKLLEPFPLEVYAELVNYDKLSEFIDTDKDVSEYFEDNDEKNVRPGFFILFYLLRKHQTALINNWMFSHEMLEDVLRIMNISNDVL